MGYKRSPPKECLQVGECFARNEDGNCTILKSTYKDGNCPFRKTKEEFRRFYHERV